MKFFCAVVEDVYIVADLSSWIGAIDEAYVSEHRRDAESVAHRRNHYDQSENE